MPPWQCMPKQLRPLAKCPTKVVAVQAAHKRVDNLAVLLKGKWADLPLDKWVALPKDKWVAWVAPAVPWAALPKGKWVAWADPVARWVVLPADKWAAWVAL